MIFDTIKFGTFTADDFVYAHTTKDFSKITALPIDIRKKFISDVIDKGPNKEINNFKQAAFDLIDGKITEKQFRDAYWNYRLETAAVAAMPLLAVVAVVAVAEYYRSYLEQHAKHLNKLIQEYEYA
jgi:hypothetical protein